MADQTITMTLTVGSINNAIRALERYLARIEVNTAEMVDKMVEQGKEVAQSSFGGMATVSGVSEGGFGIIEATGEAVVIAEFGAGMATMESHPYAGNAPVPVYRGSYSELVGSGEFAETYEATGEGSWHFGGRKYTEVIPRHGMLDAIDYIRDNAESIAREVFM